MHCGTVILPIGSVRRRTGRTSFGGRRARTEVAMLGSDASVLLVRHNAVKLSESNVLEDRRRQGSWHIDAKTSNDEIVEPEICETPDPLGDFVSR